MYSTRTCVNESVQHKSVNESVNEKANDDERVKLHLHNVTRNVLDAHLCVLCYVLSTLK
jgi:hypothetical protein